ncbi:MAG: integrase family protein [Gammaproteobacteria bacterium]|nr:integrase family protein [Gammaproteobacteria bacterium]
MEKRGFTAGRVAGFRCDPGKQQSIFWDGKTPGLGLRVTASGAKSYIFETRLHGKTLRLTIGDVRTWALGKAQEEATHYKALTDKGIDPRQQMAEQRAKVEAHRVEAKRLDLTLGEVWPVYLEARKGTWGEHHYRDHVGLAARGGERRKRGKKRTVAGPLASLLPLPLASLTSVNLAAWLEQEKATRPTSAALSYRLLRAFIRWAEGMPDYRGLIPADAYRARKVKEAVPRSQAKEGDCLQREHLPGWFAQVCKLTNPVISSYLQALLLTGARREEMARLKWADVDFQWRSLTIRDKVEGVRTIPLTPYLASLLFRLPRRKNKEGKALPWVFSSPTAADGKLTEPRIAHNAVLEAAGLPHVTLHGLRRSFGTLAEWVETPSGISAQIMGHKPSALAEKHYRRRPLDLLRKWHDKIEAWMLEQAGIVFDAAEQDQRLRVVK